MTIISYKNRIKMSILNVWFCENISDIKEECDIININGYANKIDGALNCLQSSLVVNLALDEDELFNNIKKNVRYEINRCYKEKIEYNTYNSEMLINNNDVLRKFENVYNQMYLEKNMDRKLEIEMVNRYIKQNCFLLTFAKLGDNDLVYHAYIVNDKRARLLYSCSTFRSNDKEERNLIARANKFLHWQDIKYFKNRGLGIYDFGGIKSFETPNGIDKFKMAFGGEKIEYYNIIYPKTIRGKIFIRLQKILSKI